MRFKRLLQNERANEINKTPENKKDLIDIITMCTLFSSGIQIHRVFSNPPPRI